MKRTVISPLCMCLILSSCGGESNQSSDIQLDDTLAHQQKNDMNHNEKSDSVDKNTINPVSYEDTVDFVEHSKTENSDLIKEDISSDSHLLKVINSVGDTFSNNIIELDKSESNHRSLLLGSILEYIILKTKYCILLTLYQKSELLKIWILE